MKSKTRLKAKKRRLKGKDENHYGENENFLKPKKEPLIRVKRTRFAIWEGLWVENNELKVAFEEEAELWLQEKSLIILRQGPI